MSDNVLILGAGFSRDAGIPLIGNFAETMYDIAARKSYLGQKLDKNDVELFEGAVAVRNELDRYHGRANFDERNIEDILSILAFNAFANNASAAAQLEVFKEAIARTIEISCNIHHPGVQQSLDGYDDPQSRKSAWYVGFWRNLLEWSAKGNSFPTIITFNYDLVLERSLFQKLIGLELAGRREQLFPSSHLRIQYHNSNIPNTLFLLRNRQFVDGQRTLRMGTMLEATPALHSSSEFPVEILKLHGSVNFPSVRLDQGAPYNIVAPVSKPHLLPPIFNKLSGASDNHIWEVALQRLRNARNVVIVGYSLPSSDIYMQYFLKTALGPNLNFNKLTVYDPILFKQDDPANEAMRNRYSTCFAPQMKSRIIFNPETLVSPQHADSMCGTTQDFIHTLGLAPETLLFAK